RIGSGKCRSYKSAHCAHVKTPSDRGPCPPSKVHRTIDRPGSPLRPGTAPVPSGCQTPETNRKNCFCSWLSRPIMLRSRRESHHRNGITDLNPPQLTSATKSARNCRAAFAIVCPESSEKRKRSQSPFRTVHNPERPSGVGPLFLRR